jgi:UDP-GlcNAc:undecaprenyl-phosphate GlcNAc-1-phosphate transferase
VKSAPLAFVVALVVVVALTPLVRALAFRVGAVAHPGGRHIHQKSIPRLGGVAICAGFFGSVAALYLTDAPTHAALATLTLRLFGLVAGGVAMCAVGAVDDARGIRAVYKLGLQIAVAVFAFWCGFRIEGVHVPLLGDIQLWPLALPLTIFWIVGIINAINLIDGLDGLAAGVVFFAAATNLVVAALGGAPLVAMLSAAIAGSVLGFLFYNFNPARIFMGDSGSYLLGYLLATTALISHAHKASTAISLLVPVLALGVPIFDTLFAMVRRLIERRPIFSPDRGHIHHRLLDMGLTHRRAVMSIYGVCAVFTAAAIGVSLGRAWQVGLALLGATVAMIGLARFVGYFEYLHTRLRQKARLRARDAEMLRYAIPELPRRFGAARTEEAVLDQLFRFAEQAELGFVEIVVGEGSGERIVRAWPPGFENADSAAIRDMVTASYPLGERGASATIRFGWHSDFGDVSPQSEILLQVATDMLAEHLARVGSALTPSAEPPRESTRPMAQAV